MVNFLSLMCFTVFFFGQLSLHENLNTTITGGLNNFTLIPYIVQYTVDDLSRMTSETLIHFDNKILPQNLTQRKNKTNYFNDTHENQQIKVDKHLTVKLFELLRRLDWNVTNNDLNTDLMRLKNKFNLTEDVDNDGVKLKLLNQTYLESLNQKSITDAIEYDETTILVDPSYRGEITAEMDKVVYQDETTVNYVQYEDEITTYLKNRDLEVRFRKEDEVNNSIASKAITIENDNSLQDSKKQTEGPQIRTSKDLLVTKTDEKKKDVKTIGATSNNGIDAGNGAKSEMPTPTGKIIAAEATTSQNKFVKSNRAPLIVEEDIAVVQRIKGIWIGGHCRCNYLIRSQAQKVNTGLIFIVYIYLFLQTIHM